MFAFHAELIGSVTATAERLHDDCACVTVTVEDEHGGKVSLNRASTAAIRAIGLAILAATDELPADGESAAGDGAG